MKQGDRIRAIDSPLCGQRGVFVKAKHNGWCEVRIDGEPGNRVVKKANFTVDNEEAAGD